MEKIQGKKIKKYMLSILRLLIIAVAMNCLLEVLNGRSFGELAQFASEKTLYFCLNTLIIMLTLSIAGIFKVRYMIEFLVIFIWLAIGIANFIMLNFFRTAPMTAMDLKVVKNAVLLLPNYFSALQIAWLIIGMAGLAVLVYKIMKQLAIHQNSVRQRKRSVITTILVSAFIGSATIIPLQSEEDRGSEEPVDIQQSYANYGFTYCFTDSLLGQGIQEPEDYSKTMVQEAWQKTHQEKKVNIKPNIIMVQLESVFNVERLMKNTEKIQPMPRYMELMDTYSSGMLGVPVLGDGTANTEFEVLTGMKLDFFGLGEYPYNAILKEKPAESLAYNLKNHGYATYAMHNNIGEFYNRHLVYEQLGFDAFLSLEGMEQVEFNALGWAKDAVYLDSIQKRLHSTTARDFIFAVSVQPHGKYPEEDPLGYYMTQLKEEDQFINDLVTMLEQHTEPTILVLYGDHLPPLGLTATQLVDENLYATEYVIWSNYPMPIQDKELDTYELAAQVLRQANITYNIGPIAATHLQRISQEKRDERLHLFQYDMLYGEGYIFDAINPYVNENYQWIKTSN